jgi:hypothetical protein
VQYAQRHFAFRGDVAQTGIGVAQFLQAMIALSAIWRFSYPAWRTCDPRGLG